MFMFVYIFAAGVVIYALFLPPFNILACTSWGESLPLSGWGAPIAMVACTYVHTRLVVWVISKTGACFDRITNSIDDRLFE